MKNEGNEMAQAVLLINKQVVPRRTCAPLTKSEINSVLERAKRAIQKKYWDLVSLPPKTTKLEFEVHDLINEPIEGINESIRMMDKDPIDADGKTAFEKPLNDLLIHAAVLLPQGESIQQVKVKGRAMDIHGHPVGTYDSNPLLNSIVYDVEFPDGTLKQYLANIFAQNMYSQVDEHGHSKALLDCIVNFKRDGNAVSKEDKYVFTKSGQRRFHESTAGWKLLVHFNDTNEQWTLLRVLKETNPVEVAEFAKAQDLVEEAAFHWLVPYTLRE